MRGLAAYGRTDVAARAAEVLLDRQIVFRRTTGAPLDPAMLAAHVPTYWHYDILDGLTALTESGHIADPRAARALDALESLRLPSGWWPSPNPWYRVSPTLGSTVDSVSWGPHGRARPNPWVTLRALRVLVAAGRVKPA